jgi:16S rRNA (guanine527-N7)-methyltransferase
MPTSIEQFAGALTAHAPEFGVDLSLDQIERLSSYYALLLKWNPRLHLVAPCSPAEFATRHVLESLLLLQHLPQMANVVDVGSGAGLPIVPCLLMRDDLAAILIESSAKKCAFLREVLRPLRPVGRAQLINSRFEDQEPLDAKYLTCRALERFGELLPTLVEWALPGTTFLIFAGDAVRKQAEQIFSHTQLQRIPHSDKRFLITAISAGN